jgi:hypothetical protein
MSVLAEVNRRFRGVFCLHHQGDVLPLVSGHLKTRRSRSELYTFLDFKTELKGCSNGDYTGLQTFKYVPHSGLYLLGLHDRHLHKYFVVI